MKPKALALFVYLAAGATSFGGQVRNERTEAEIAAEFRARGFPQERIASLTDSDRKVLIGYLWAQLAVAPPKAVSALPDQISRRILEDTLLALGEPRIISEKLDVITRERMESYEFYPTLDQLVQSRQPEVIKALAPLVNSDEPYVVAPLRPGQDIGNPPPKSFAICGAILELLQSSKYFDGSVRSWAKAHQVSDPVVVRTILQEWWKKNAELFERKEYGKVLPGRDYRSIELKQWHESQKLRVRYVNPPTRPVYSDEEILAALQQRIEFRDPDAVLYYTDEDRKVVAEFMKKNQPLFDSLGKDETDYFLRLAALNRNPNALLSVISSAIDAYKRNYAQYSVAERDGLKVKFLGLRKGKLLSEEQWVEVKTYEPK